MHQEVHLLKCLLPPNKLSDGALSHACFRTVVELHYDMSNHDDFLLFPSNSGATDNTVDLVNCYCAVVNQRCVIARRTDHKRRTYRVNQIKTCSMMI
jgi:hypothetical protein